MSGDPLPVLSDLTPSEEHLLDGARRGAIAQVSGLRVHLVEVAAPEVRGRFIRELLLGRHGDLDPRGVRLTGARITGDLDLAHVRAKSRLYLSRCTIGGSFSAVNAQIESLTCTDCRIHRFRADQVRIDNALNLARTRVTGTSSPLSLRNAHVGALDCTELEVYWASGIAFDADSLHVDGDLLLRRARIRGTGQRGALRLPNASVGGQLSGFKARIVNGSGPAVHADGVRVHGDLFLNNAWLEGADQHGAVRLPGAEIGSQADLSDARVTNPSGPAVTADNMQANDLHLMDSRIMGAGPGGALRLPAARISGQLHGHALEVVNPSGPAIDADGLAVSTELYLRKAQLTGAGEHGAVRLLGATIGGQFVAEKLRADNHSGPGLAADGIKVHNNFSLTGAHIAGSGPRGAVRLVGARLGSQFQCDGMQAVNASGPGLSADHLVVESSLSLRNARIAGAGDHGALRLHSAKVSGQFDLRAAWIRSAHGATIGLTSAQAGSQVFLPARLVCPQPWGHSCRWSTAIDLEHFTFGSLASLSWRQWLHLIRFHTPEYTPSPYQKLAAAERAAGHDGNARHILIAQQQDFLRRDADALGGRLTRFFHRSWGVLAGYGYRARRTAAALALALLAAVTVGLVAGHITDGAHHAAERVTSFALPIGQPCTPVELIGVGLDRGLPLSPTGVRTRCDLNTETTAGQWLTLLIWLIQAAVWGLATLALAGYTGLIRKPA
ncbi:hypothetical protein [Amycolatopsis sp. Hca4]|uniref:hypothetical protein n=1 Tax=Amycolatopsis sp. Hca4 TaxID=2742131 RepID=UPI001591DC33|nr:hypothetical protein [Amycolatopsis sp. Hca4]QKV73290.1 hypothetical protein HUT10_05425 [Amycolatopsis sp. Hca4]